MSKSSKRAHTPISQIGMGDSYGSGIKNKVGRVRENLIVDVRRTDSNKQAPKPGIKKSVRSLA